jgi:O-antigen ligase
VHADRIRPALLALLILAALPFGCSEDAWRWGLITALGLVFCLFLWSGGPITIGRRDKLALALGCAWLLWLGFQVLPMPPSLLSRLSPEAHRLYQVAVPGAGGGDPAGYAWPAVSPPGEPSAAAAASADASATWTIPSFSSWRTISLYPYGTWRNLVQSAVLLGFVVMMLSLFRERRHQRWLAATVMGLALFQAAYGSLELLTGHQHIFAYEKRFYTDSATGTLVNRNHYAALLNLALPLMVVLLLDRRPRGRAPLDRKYLPARMRWTQMAAPLREPFLLSMAIVTGIAVVLSRSRMGLAALLAGLLSLSVLLAWQGRAWLTSRSSGHQSSRARWVWAWPLLLFLGICLYSLATDATPTMERFRRIHGDLDAGAMRPALWAESLPLLRGYLWTGSGSGAYPHAVNAAMTRQPLADFWEYDHAHNDYLETLATLGLVGTLLAVGALGVLVVRRPPSLQGLAAMAAMVTLLVHSAVDFPLATPVNALLACAVLCLIALPGPQAAHGHGHRVAAPSTRRGRGRVLAGALALVIVCVWPARSMVSAALAGSDQGNTGAPGDVRRLRLASALEPGNDRHARRLGQALLAEALRAPSGDVVLGDAMGPQARKLRLEMLSSLAAAHRELLRCVDLSPVDYTLHAELARTASNMRTLARECGIAEPEKRSGLVSPQVTSAALAPTAWDNQIAMAALLWKERLTLGEPAASIALDLLARVQEGKRLWPEWKKSLVQATEDAPSLARLDEAVRPPPEAYADLVDSRAGESTPALAACAVALQTRAALRESRGTREKGAVLEECRDALR